MTRRLLVGAALAAALVLGAVAGVLGWQWYQSVGTMPRPAFSLPDLDGERRSISEWDGEIVVVNFWATWCAPCREEIPLFTELQSRLGHRGVQFVGVAIDRLPALRRFAEEFDINYPTLHGIQSAMAVQDRFGNDAGTLPYTVVIDRRGYVRHIFARAVTREDIEPVLEDMLAGSSGS